MKKLLLISTLISLITLPVLAHDANGPHKHPEQPEVRRHEAMSDEHIEDCISTTKDVYCAESEDAGIYQVNDSNLYNNCPRLGCVKVEGDFYIRGDNEERLIQVNPNNN